MNVIRAARLPGSRSGAIMYISDILYKRDCMNISVADIRARLADVLNRVAYRGERVVLERRGKGVAAIVPLEDLERLEAMEEAADVRAAKRSRRERGGVSLRALKDELGL